MFFFTHTNPKQGQHFVAYADKGKLTLSLVSHTRKEKLSQSDVLSQDTGPLSWRDDLWKLAHKAGSCLEKDICMELSLPKTLKLLSQSPEYGSVPISHTGEGFGK